MSQSRFAPNISRLIHIWLLPFALVVGSTLAFAQFDVGEVQTNRYPGISLELVGPSKVYERAESFDDPEQTTLRLTADSELIDTVVISLTIGGNAKRGADYDLPLSIRLPAGTTSYDFAFASIRDWIREGDETATVRIGSVRGPAHVVAAKAIELTIDDDFEAPPDDDGEEPTVIETVRSPDLDAYTDLWGADSSGVQVRVLVRNYGSEQSAPTTARVDLSTDIYFNDVEQTVNLPEIPELDALGGAAAWLVTFDYNELQQNVTYYAEFTVAPVEGESSTSNNDAVMGFATDSSSRVRTQCVSLDRPDPIEGEDVFFQHQWHLINDGQSSYSRYNSLPGSDLNMRDTIEQGFPTGVDVQVAVVDTGMELCHPDLANNVEAGRSFNFASDPFSSRNIFGSSSSDPFNADIYGDHGTSMAGLIAAEADNTVGGRGVAPDARLRAFNYLQVQGATNSRLALGFGDNNRLSADVDIFNMSLGAGLSSSRNNDSVAIFKNGVENLRDGKGALYIKSAGNGFNRCRAIYHPINDDIGCLSSNVDFSNILPYLIVVGAYLSLDERSDYASTGANIWVTAPGGRYGYWLPALISTDQMGRDRGYHLNANYGISNHAQNEYGDYVSTANGTSGSTAVASGVTALLLEAKPELTWRDVKHVYANTSRWIHPFVRPIRVAINEIPYVMLDGWTINAAGYAHHSWYGFGSLNVDEALHFAETYEPDSLGVFHESPWITTEEGEWSIPDGDGGGTWISLEVTPDNLVPVNEDETVFEEVEVTETRNIESVVLRISINHENLSDVGVTLVTPNGTRSIVNPIFNNSLPAGTVEYEYLEFSTNTFYGESPFGEWQIHLADVQSENQGTVDEAALQIYTGVHPDRFANEENEEVSE